MRGGRVVDGGDALRHDVSEAGWFAPYAADPSDATRSGRQGLRAGRGYRPEDDATRYLGPNPDLGKREY